MALDFDHELSHAEGMDEVGAIFSNVILLKSIGQTIPNALQDSNPYLKLLSEASAETDIEVIIDMVSAYLDTLLTQTDPLTGLPLMTKEERLAQIDRNVAKGGRDAARAQLKSIMVLMGLPFELGLSMQRTPILNMLLNNLKEIVGSDQLALDKSLDDLVIETVERLASGEITVNDLDSAVAKVVSARAELEEQASESAIQSMKKDIFQILLQMSVLMRGADFSEVNLESLAEAIALNGDLLGVSSENMKRMTLDQLISVFSAMPTTAEDITAVSTPRTEYFSAIQALKAAKSVVEALVIRDRIGSIAESAQKAGNEDLAVIAKRSADRFLVLSEMDEVPEFAGLAEAGVKAIDFIASDYVSPRRNRIILAELLKQQQNLTKGVVSVLGFTDKARVDINLENGILRMRVLSENDQYGERWTKMSPEIFNEIKEQSKPQVLVLGGEPLGVEIGWDAENGKPVVNANSLDYQKFARELWNAKNPAGQNLVKQIISLVVTDIVDVDNTVIATADQVAKSLQTPEGQESVLRSLLGDESFERLSEAGQIDKNIMIMATTEDEAAA
ncbi:MAG: hypothetical protein P9M03_07830, partial [Candidatus Theseobacter exili]|nr:hypothetical protein [Candidatus Theseobacter exili]